MDKRLAILRFIFEYRRKHGYPPTVREIGDEMGMSSTSVVHYYLNQLLNEHLLYKQPKVARGLRISLQGRAALGEPVQRGA